jgi:hypothetical protein
VGWGREHSLMIGLSGEHTESLEQAECSDPMRRSLPAACGVCVVALGAVVRPPGHGGAAPSHHHAAARAHRVGGVRRRRTRCAGGAGGEHCRRRRQQRWVLGARRVTLRGCWVTLRARWVTLLRARWVTLRARWVTLRGMRGDVQAVPRGRAWPCWALRARQIKTKRRRSSR